MGYQMILNLRFNRAIHQLIVRCIIFLIHTSPQNCIVGFRNMTQVAIITGGGRGLGKAFALAMADMGMHVVVTLSLIHI